MWYAILGLVIIGILIVALINNSDKKENVTKCQICEKEFKNEEEKNVYYYESTSGGKTKVICNECKAKLASKEITMPDSKPVQLAPKEITCPKCHSNQLSAEGKKLSLGRAVVGNVVADSLYRLYYKCLYLSLFNSFKSK